MRPGLPGPAGAVPTLTDGVVTLRGPRDSDVQGSVEQCQDPLSRRWTTAPVPYTAEDARTYLHHVIPGGWETDREWAFVVEAPDEGVEGDEGAARFAGTISLRNLLHGRAEVAYGAHPWARGRGLMERALRLLLEWGFAERGVHTMLWLARRGNWPSRRLAWRLGFTCDGTLRHWLPGAASEAVTSVEDLSDGWIGTLSRDDPREPRTRWLDPPTIHGHHVVLRAATDDDLARVVETGNDPATRRWLAGFGAAAPYSLEEAAERALRLQEDAAAGTTMTWTVADPDSGRCLGSVGIFRIDPSIEGDVGFWTHPDARGRGVAREACRLAVRHGFVDGADGGLGLLRLTAHAAVGNDASVRVLEQSGFRRIGLARGAAPVADGPRGDAVLYDQLAGDVARHAW